MINNIAKERVWWGRGIDFAILNQMVSVDLYWEGNNWVFEQRLEERKGNNFGNEKMNKGIIPWIETYFYLK